MSKETISAAITALLLTAVDRPSSNLALLSGGVLALAALTRPSALALAALLSAPLFDRDYPLHRYYLWAKWIQLNLGGAAQQLRKLGLILANEPV